jgi:hypothetical protein
MTKKLEKQILKLKYIVRNSKKSTPRSIRLPLILDDLATHEGLPMQTIVDIGLAYYLAYESDFEIDS